MKTPTLSETTPEAACAAQLCEETETRITLACAVLNGLHLPADLAAAADARIEEQLRSGWKFGGALSVFGPAVRFQKSRVPVAVTLHFWLADGALISTVRYTEEREMPSL